MSGSFTFSALKTSLNSPLPSIISGQKLAVKFIGAPWRGRQIFFFLYFCKILFLKEQGTDNINLDVLFPLKLSTKL